MRNADNLASTRFLSDEVHPFGHQADDLIVSYLLIRFDSLQIIPVHSVMGHLKSTAVEVEGTECPGARTLSVPIRVKGVKRRQRSSNKYL